jgi:superfamily I DNA/RNA helicase
MIATSIVERLILGLIDNVTSDEETTEKILLSLNMSPRWLRRAALYLALTAPPSSHTKESYLTLIRDKVSKLSYPHNVELKSVNSFFRRVSDEQWATLNLPVDHDQFVKLPYSTVHGVKGQEFDGVVLVLPQHFKRDDENKTPLDHWEGNTDKESKRVLYVGASRAKRTLVIATHTSHLSRISALLNRDSVLFEII